MESSLSLIVPVYNEEASLPGLLPELLEFCEREGHRLIVVDDGSTDGSAGILAEHREHACLSVLRHKLNRGYGGAIKEGVAHADTTYVITLDADGQHRLADVQRLYDLIRERDADMVVGKRGRLRGESLYRKLGKTLIRVLARILLPVTIEDLNSGMKIYRTELAQRYLPLCPDTMAYSDIIALTFVSQRHLVLEHPITIAQRSAGTSTISTMTAIDTVREILNIVVLFNPMRIFFPIALLLILSGLVWGVPIVLQGRGVSVGAMLGLIAGLIFFFLGLIAEQLSLIRKSSVRGP